MIRDETKRVRQPAAWLLLGGVTISVFVGLMAMLSNSWAAAANAGTLIALAGGGAAGPTFADRAVVASHELTSLPLTAMAVAAVVLATHLGEQVRQARRITLFAVILQAVALLLGVLGWLAALGMQGSGSARLGFFLNGAVGVMVAAAGLFFSVVTLRSAALQAAGQRVTEKQAVLPRANAGSAAAERAAAQTAQYPAAASQQGMDQRATDQWATDQWATAQQTYGPYGEHTSQQQAYQGDHAQQSYGQGSYDAGKQQPDGQGYAFYVEQGHQGYDQQPWQSVDTYRPQDTDVYQPQGAGGFQPQDTDVYQPQGAGGYQPQSTDTYQQYYRQQARPTAEHGSAETAQPGHSLDEGDSREHR